jgi:hypothetical protein
MSEIDLDIKASDEKLEALDLFESDSKENVSIIFRLKN